VPLADLATPSPGFCQTPEYAWRHASGPDIQELTSPEGEVRLVTKSEVLDELIGETVGIDVTATKGPFARDEVSLQVPITVDPFVKVERRVDSPAASETDLVGVLVHLTNTTGCDVSGVLYEETLEGLSLVEGSVKLDGEPVTALSSKSSSTALQVEVPVLAGNATRTLSYVARPHLVGERRMGGEARKNGAVISMSDAPGPGPSSCGCSSGGPGPMLLVLAALGGALRCQRRPTVRS
jgi:MYXO-CTERM domain-containing protein